MIYRISKYKRVQIFLTQLSYGRFYYLIKHVKSCVSSCFNKYKIVGKELGKVCQKTI